MQMAVELMPTKHSTDLASPSVEIGARLVVVRPAGPLPGRFAEIEAAGRTSLPICSYEIV
jgi:hypothetical protein